MSRAVLAGVYEEDSVNFPEGVIFYPVKYLSEELPFPIAGMSDEMPYKSTRYKDFTEEMFQAYRSAFQMVVRKAVEEFCPDLIVCHHPVSSDCVGAGMVSEEESHWNLSWL